MFCALNGATATPRPLSQAQMAVAIQLLPAFEDVPPTNNGRAVIALSLEPFALCLLPFAFCLLTFAF
jgi:hypothetical protein